jgi:hypothetical protein
MPPKRHFGPRQPTRIEQTAAVRSLICGCRDLDRLDLHQLARRAGVDVRQIEAWVGAERRVRVG